MERVKDLGSISNSFCLTERDVANCRQVRFRERKRPALDSRPCPAWPFPPTQPTGEPLNCVNKILLFLFWKKKKGLI